MAAATIPMQAVAANEVILTDDNLKVAVQEWFAQPDLATTKYGQIREWDTSRITDMHALFQGQADFNEDIGLWNTSQVTNLSYLFNRASSFDQDLSAWDTHQVRYMDGIFNFATSFNGDIGSWSTPSLQSMDDAFGHATSFNIDISGWDTRRLLYASHSFRDATSFSQDLSPWSVSQLQDATGMFLDAQAFDQTLCWDVPETAFPHGMNLFCGSPGTLDANCVSSMIVLDRLDDECSSGSNNNKGDILESLATGEEGQSDSSEQGGDDINTGDLVSPTHTTISSSGESPDSGNLLNTPSSQDDESYDRLKYTAMTFFSASLVLTGVLCLFVLWKRRTKQTDVQNDDEKTVAAEDDDDDYDAVLVKESNLDERIQAEGILHVC